MSALALLGFTAGRNLFWSAPAFGRLYLRSEDNPFGQVAAVVTFLRRWSPRRMRGQRTADTVIGLALGFAVAWGFRVVLRVPSTATDARNVGSWTAQHWQPVIAGVVAAFLVGGAVVGQHARPPRQSPWPERWRRVRRFLPWRLRRGVSRTAALAKILSLLPWRMLRFLVQKTGHWVSRLLFGPETEHSGEDLLPTGPVGALLGLGVGGALGYLAFALDPPDPVWAVTLRYPLLAAAIPLLVVLLGVTIWAALARRHSRRPVVLVIDDLDRCPADRVVKLLETVHTLLREPSRVSLFRRWRQAAPFVVLVLADGRWIRNAFEISFEKFQPLGSDVHGLGVDFLQKVFDHVVLVPPLAADQVQAYVDDVTELSHWAVSGRRRVVPPAPPGSDLAAAPTPHPHPASDQDEVPDETAARRSKMVGTPRPDEDTDAVPKDLDGIELDGIEPARDRADDRPSTEAPSSPESRAEQLLRDTPPSRALGSDLQQVIAAAPAEDRQRLAEAAASKAASKTAIAAFSEHLLSSYMRIMPANPRLVTRVANTFGMLLAVRWHLNHSEPDDYVARAAILMVRFPSLVDELLSEPEPPGIDPTVAASGREQGAASDSPWHRRDVQQLLRTPEGTLIDAVRLARCFGREYAPAVPDSAAASPAPPLATTTTSGNVDGISIIETTPSPATRSAPASGAGPDSTDLADH